MIEVEVKARIENFEDMEKKLTELGAVYTKSETQKDLYFQSPITDFAKSDEALRIRKTDNNTFITYKGPKIDESSKTRKEIEIKVEDMDKCSEIFEHIGFKKVRCVKKSRKYFKYENFEISLDDVYGLKPYMEIEISLDDNSNYEDALKSIFELYEKLQITEGFERTSYLELLENI